MSAFFVPSCHSGNSQEAPEDVIVVPKVGVEPTRALPPNGF